MEVQQESKSPSQMSNSEYLNLRHHLAIGFHWRGRLGYGTSLYDKGLAVDLTIDHAIES